MVEYDMNGNVIPANPQKQNGRIIRQVTRRRGTSIEIIDAARTALPPGWRMSRNGKFYHEARVNRTDKSNRV